MSKTKSSWNQARKFFSDRVDVRLAGPAGDNVTLGTLHVLGQKIQVKVFAFVDGLVICRRPFSSIRSKLRVNWASIKFLHEYSIPITRTMADHTQAEIVSYDDAAPILRLPWRHSFREYLPEPTHYFDRRHD